MARIELGNDAWEDASAEMIACAKRLAELSRAMFNASARAEETPGMSFFATMEARAVEMFSELSKL